MDEKELAARLSIVERLTQLFKLERMVYLFVTTISVLMLLINSSC